jgi:hypothetical protein
MTDPEKQILKSHLDAAYDLLKQLSNSKIKGTTEYKAIFELENINIKLDLPFND